MWTGDSHNKKRSEYLIAFSSYSPFLFFQYSNKPPKALVLSRPHLRQVVKSTCCCRPFALSPPASEDPRSHDVACSCFPSYGSRSTVGYALVFRRLVFCFQWMEGVCLHLEFMLRTTKTFIATALRRLHRFCCPAVSVQPGKLGCEAAGRLVNLHDPAA